ncbi:MAG TPA: VOC family protein [Stellaceae bacterium]|nr:VOC family protein [Stellaceae bacterium]
MAARLVPELDVADLDRSLAFYVGVAGFRIMFGRPEERFVYLDRDGAQLMLEEAVGPGRRFRTAPLDHPYGRGMNLMIEVSDVVTLHAAVAVAGSCEIVIPLEERWYRANEIENGQRQFVAADPDGYLLRFFTELGQRPAGSGGRGPTGAARRHQPRERVPTARQRAG